MSNLVNDLSLIPHALVKIAHITDWAKKVAPIDVMEMPCRAVFYRVVEDYASHEQIDLKRHDWDTICKFLNAMQRWSWMVFNVHQVRRAAANPSQIHITIALTINPDSPYAD